MIQFHLHSCHKTTKVGPWIIRRGQPVLKVVFSEEDIHRSRSGKLHLDIWGAKLTALKRTITRPSRLAAVRAFVGRNLLMCGVVLIVAGYLLREAFVSFFTQWGRHESQM